jgi:hypothetical protein
MLKFNFIIAVLIVGIFQFSDTFSQEFAPRGRERMETAKKMKLLEILDLTEAEADKFLIKYTTAEKLIKEKNEQFRKANESLIEYLDDSPNGKELNDKTNAVVQAQKELHSAIENRFSTLKQSLSDQNFAKYLAFEIEFTRRLKKFLTDKDDDRGKPAWEGVPPKLFKKK